MSIGRINNAESDSDKDQLQGEFGVEHNPNGPWANLEDGNLKNAIVRLAASNHVSCAADNPKLSKFADFLDVFASAWLEQKAQVEKEAQKYGFAPCKTTEEIPEEDRRNAALLSLTLNGSFVLLGNGCLSYSGSFGHYEKIPFRKDGSHTTKYAESGVVVSGEAVLNSPLNLSTKGNFVGNTSPLQALYFTKENLFTADALQLENALSESVVQFSHMIRGGMDENFSGTSVPRQT